MTDLMAEQILNIDRMEQAVALFGSFDSNIKQIENAYLVTVTVRGGEMKISGDAENVSRAARAVNSLLLMLNKGETLNEQNVGYVLSLVDDGDEDKLSRLSENGCICIQRDGR